MDTIDCAKGEELRFDEDVRLKITGRSGELLFVFIDAPRALELKGHDGFHATAPCRDRRNAHVLGLLDGDRFEIGPIRIHVERVQVVLPGAQALRDVRLRIDTQIPYVRATPERVRRRLRRAGEQVSCWS